MKISVLSPVYNEQTHLPEMLDSLKAQTHEDWEVLFVDDGSTDDTVQVIRQAAEADPRFRLVAHGEKFGKAKAFNMAFEASCGDAVVLLAGDDRLPQDSLAVRAADIATCVPGDLGLAAYKLRSFSEDAEFDGMELPRGDATSASGGVLTFTRELADLVFPIPESLPSEDIWLGFAGPALTRRYIRNPVVVLEYRIHGGNSNPRGRDFETMSASIAPRHEAWRLLLEQERFLLPAEDRVHLDALYSAEKSRRQGNVLGVLTQRGLSKAERGSLAAMSDPRLWSLRQRFYKILSGRQGR
ncbi:Glycosyltransferase involved in cell wall bisynthesis [Austwickia chelonae]|uniref:Putative glycosyltransferase n=1 Tax=Austwickia chelonae NBRC 105200 TaxID=1184607 RepID=K6VS29_9MICO|nr:glycosyltransferase family 2 protein [Austwickia chelonae]GAB78145.1 putative glycosyltransferase [Austwickia chelonae NBRC 105200]SEV97573.1 Glycosyltransferase involved in cell wall bisynthesis [Austwickia chelonae]